MGGFVNSHSHVFQRALRGRAERAGQSREDFWSWRNAMYALVEALDPETLQAIATYTYAEMLAAGYTRVKEFHYLHHQRGGTPYADVHELSLRLVAAAEAAGIDLELLRVAYPNVTEPAQSRFADPSVDVAIARTADLASRVDVPVGIAPHSVRAVSLDGFVACARWASEAGSECHAHVAEQPKEVAWAEATLGRRPLAALADRDVLSPSFVGVHLTHLDAAEIAACGVAALTACICPTTEANLGDGVPQTRELLEAGVRLAIGSDSQAEIDPFLELRLLEYNERNRWRQRQVLDPPALLAAACEPVVPGQPARLIELDLLHPTLIGVGAEHLASAVVMAGRPDCVRAAWFGATRRESRPDPQPFLQVLARVF
ncbi:MAG: formimidoylglutamate deiminase [Myxococcota bacterium]|jgi:formimidoylglutamate deiminase